MQNIRFGGKEANCNFCLFSRSLSFLSLRLFYFLWRETWNSENDNNVSWNNGKFDTQASLLRSDYIFFSTYIPHYFSDVGRETSIANIRELFPIMPTLYFKFISLSLSVSLSFDLILFFFFAPAIDLKKRRKFNQLCYSIKSFIC